MFSLTLLRFSPLSKETNLIAVLVAFLAFFVDYAAMPTATATSSFATAIVVGACWYVYKVFDGVTYDGIETASGSMIGILLTVIICATYFTI